MHSRRFACLVAAISLGFTSLSAFAQGQGDRGEHRGWSQQQPPQRAGGNRASRDHDRDRHGDDRDRRDRDHDRDRDGGERRDHEVYYYGARGPEWHRGARLPPPYRSHQYVVNDWHGHHLRPPPPGHYWVQVGADYVLVAIATGIIVQVLLNSSY